MIKKIFLILLLFLFLSLIPELSLANNPTEIYLFYDETCPICTQAQIFLGQLKRKYPQLEIRAFNAIDNSEIQKLYFSLKKAYQMDSELVVPVIFIGEKSFDSYNSAVATEIEQTVIKCLAQQCPSPLDKIKKQNVVEEKETKSALPYFFIGGGLLILFLLIKK